MSSDTLGLHARRPIAVECSTAPQAVLIPPNKLWDYNISPNKLFDRCGCRASRRTPLRGGRLCGRMPPNESSPPRPQRPMPLIQRLSRLWHNRNGRIVLASLLIFFSTSTVFISKLMAVYAARPGGLLFALSVVGLFAILTVLFFLLICHGPLVRWVLALFAILSSQAAYFMAQYGVVIDTQMIDNLMHTDTAEAWGLMTPSLLVYTLLLGALPAWLILRSDFHPTSWWQELRSRALLMVSGIAAAALLVLPFSSSYASFIREHKDLRLYVSPLYYSYSTLRYAATRLLPAQPRVHEAVATDTHELGSHEANELIVLVVGETARADRFSLNGYHRDTNPKLRRQDVVSFTQVTSCGTSTAVSVPCMFSALGRAHYDADEAARKDNALDVLARSGVKILWRDNNSDSKGVADRIAYENFRSAERNRVCDPECRDVGMLDGLDEFIGKNAGHDLLIVLHQMGSHGPEYYKRYPAAFEAFRPVCKTGELQDCSTQTIDNAYDNTIRYTDHFLSSVIEFLKRYDGSHETAMLYVSDHGESLGENGLYLHGAPYALAPDAQTHVPAVLWLGQHADYSIDQARAFRDHPVSHDDLFCLLLLAFERETRLCDKQKGLLAAHRELGRH